MDRWSTYSLHTALILKPGRLPNLLQPMTMDMMQCHSLTRTRSPGSITQNTRVQYTGSCAVKYLHGEATVMKYSCTGMAITLHSPILFCWQMAEQPFSGEAGGTTTTNPMLWWRSLILPVSRRMKKSETPYQSAFIPRLSQERFPWISAYQKPLLAPLRSTTFLEGRWNQLVQTFPLVEFISGNLGSFFLREVTLFR